MKNKVLSLIMVAVLMLNMVACTKKPAKKMASQNNLVTEDSSETVASDSESDVTEGTESAAIGEMTQEADASQTENSSAVKTPTGDTAEQSDTITSPATRSAEKSVTKTPASSTSSTATKTPASSTGSTATKTPTAPTSKPTTETTQSPTTPATTPTTQPTKEQPSHAPVLPNIHFNGIDISKRCNYDWDGKSQFVSLMSGWRCPDIKNNFSGLPEDNLKGYFSMLVNTFGMYKDPTNKNCDIWYRSIPGTSVTFMTEISIEYNEIFNGFSLRVDDHDTEVPDDYDYRNDPFIDSDRLYAIVEQILKSLCPNDYYKIWMLLFGNTGSDFNNILKHTWYLPEDDREIRFDTFHNVSGVFVRISDKGERLNVD